MAKYMDISMLQSAIQVQFDHFWRPFWSTFNVFFSNFARTSQKLCTRVAFGLRIFTVIHDLVTLQAFIKWSFMNQALYQWSYIFLWLRRYVITLRSYWLATSDPRVILEAMPSSDNSIVALLGRLLKTVGQRGPRT